MLGPPVFAAFRIIPLRECLWLSDRGFAFAVVAVVLMLFERVRWCSEVWWARVRARRREERWTARSSAEGGSPKMKNFMKKKIRRAMESWPRRKPCVKERLGVLVVWLRDVWLRNVRGSLGGRLWGWQLN